MKAADVMSTNVRVVAPELTVQEAARQMLDGDTGALIVGTPDAPSGMITDRDIAVRAVAQGRGPDTPVSDVMTGDLVTVRADQDLDEVAVMMSDRQVRRVAVLDEGGTLAGVISLGDLSKSDDPDRAEAAMTGIARPGGEHQQ